MTWPATQPTWLLTAIDGADEDGGTLYVLYGASGAVLHAASWPQPLEQLAASASVRLVRISAAAGGSTEALLGAAAPAVTAR